MKKMLFAIMIATSLMSASFANAQTEAKTTTVSKQKSEKAVVKQNGDKTNGVKTTKTKTVVKKENATSTK